MDRPVPEKLDMGFLFYGHEVLQVECVIVKYKATRIKHIHDTYVTLRRLRGCLHDTGATFAPRRVHSGSLSWLYICLHDTTTKSHAGASRPGVSSLQLSHRGENFNPVRNLATVSCKHETTTRFGVKSACR